MSNTGDLFADADVISSYSRAEALEDGLLVDVTEQSRRAGFTGKVPFAITRAVWAVLEAVPEDARADITIRMLREAATAVAQAKIAGEDLEAASPVELAPLGCVGAPPEPLWLCFTSFEGFTLLLPSDY